MRPQPPLQRLRIPLAHARRRVAEREFAARQAARLGILPVQAEGLVQVKENAFDDGGRRCQLVLGRVPPGPGPPGIVRLMTVPMQWKVLALAAGSPCGGAGFSEVRGIDGCLEGGEVALLVTVAPLMVLTSADWADRTSVRSSGAARLLIWIDLRSSSVSWRAVTSVICPALDRDLDLHGAEPRLHHRSLEGPRRGCAAGLPAAGPRNRSAADEPDGPGLPDEPDVPLPDADAAPPEVPAPRCLPPSYCRCWWC